jgi:DNA-binding MurR/RpiR family transcriptional regulator
MRSSILRLSSAIVGGKRRRLPHEPKTLDAARELFEKTMLSYREISRRTGVSPATLTRQARRGGWIRCQKDFTEEHYSAEGRRILRRRALAERLMRQAERRLDELETNPRTTPAALKQAIRFVKAAREMDRIG